MAQIDTGGGGQGRHDKKKKAKKLSTRIDMTPMVDLAFLLLTFFVLTSTFSKPKVLRMIFPEKVIDKTKKAPQLKHGITLILSGENRLFYYENDSIKYPDKLHEISYAKEGLRAMLKRENVNLLSVRERLQKKLNALDEKDTAAIRKIEVELDTSANNDKFAVVVKHDDGAAYRNMIDVVDEFLLTQIGRYYVADEPLSPTEKKELLKARSAKK